MTTNRDRVKDILSDFKQDLQRETRQSRQKRTSKERRDGENAARRSARGETLPLSEEETFLEDLDCGLPSRLSLAAYLRQAVGHSRAESEERPAECWESPLWGFLRLAKAHPELIKADAGEALRRVERVLMAWNKAADLPRGADPWGEWFDVEQEDARAEFFEAWDKIRLLPGRTPLEAALELARATPLILRPEERRTRPPGYTAFVSLAGWLQVVAGDQNILLPVEDVGRLLRCSPRTVSSYRRWAAQDGYLRLVRGHVFRSKDEVGQATEFRFDVRLFGALLERAAPGTAEAFSREHM
jgi:hypothetical protein